MPIKLIPLGNRIITEKPVKPEPVTSSGILLTAAAEPEPENIAKVLAIGDEVTNIAVGEYVIFPKYGATEIEEDGTEYLILDVSDLLAKRKTK